MKTKTVCVTLAVHQQQHQQQRIGKMMTMVEGTSIDLGDPIALDAAATAAGNTSESDPASAAAEVESAEERCA